jgi:hypothetical protein
MIHTEEEIKMIYNQSKNQKQQIKILAQLNAVPTFRIMNILGLATPITPCKETAKPKRGRPFANQPKNTAPKVRTYNVLKTKDNHEAVQRLYLLGKSDKEIAELMCFRVGTIRRWRKENGLSNQFNEEDL